MTDTLYERLGGEAGISTLVDRIVDLHLVNPLVSTRSATTDQERARAVAKAFLAAGSRGPEPDTGKSRPETHRDVNISEQEFVAVVDDVMQAMEELGYALPERDDVLSVAYSLKDDIVRV